MKIVGKVFKSIGRLLARKSVRHVAAICALFGLVIGGGAYTARHNAGLSQMLGLASAPVEPARTDNLTGSHGLKDDDPVKNFTKTGVGQVLFTASSSDNCKRTLFDNKTGSYKEVADINCGNSTDQMIDDKKSEQLQSMRKAFRK
jgi:hypothetical protein